MTTQARGFWRDLTIDATGQVFFQVQPSWVGDLWILNTGTLSLTINLKGKNKNTTFTLAKNNAAKVWVDNGDEIQITGGNPNDQIAITSTFDIKPIATGGDILGKVQVVDANSNIVNFSSPAAVKATLSGSFVNGTTTAESTGQGLTITPVTNSGIIFVHLGSTVRNDTANQLAGVYVYFNTTGIPAAGTSVGADTQLIRQQANEPVANANILINGDALVTGLIKNTTYFFYIASNSPVSGNVTVLLGGNLSVLFAFELSSV